MPRVKEKIYAVEILEEDTLRQYHNYLDNFISKEKTLYQSFHLADKRNLFDSDKAKKDLQELIKDTNKKECYPIDNETVFIDEISHSGKLKLTDEYLYRFFDYNEKKGDFCTFNELITYLKKKIKNKYAIVYYNGITKKIEFSEDTIKPIIKEMTEDTHTISLNQLNGKGDEYEPIIIVPFKVIK